MPPSSCRAVRPQRKDNCQGFSGLRAVFYLSKVCVHVQPQEGAVLRRPTWEAEIIVNKRCPFECAMHASPHLVYCYFSYFSSLFLLVGFALHDVPFLCTFNSRECVFRVCLSQCIFEFFIDMYLFVMC